MRPADTSPEAWSVWLDLVRRMTPEEKLRRTFALSAMVRRGMAEGVRQRYPQASEEEVFLRTSKLILGDELFERAYGQALTDGK